MKCPVDNEELKYDPEIGWYCETCGFNHKDSESEKKPSSN